MGVKVSYVVGKYPCASERFIAREIAALNRRGFDVDVFALEGNEAGDDDKTDALNVRYRPGVFSLAFLLDPLLMFFSSPGRFVRAIGLSLNHRPDELGFFRCIRHFVSAVSFARRARIGGTQHIHTHFAFVTAHIGRAMAAMLGTRYTVSVHAWDIYAQRTDAIAAYTVGAQEVFACTERGRDRFLESVPDMPADRLHVMRHGIVPDEWEMTAGRGQGRILAVGRLVPKKGFADLIKTCKLMADRGVAFSCVIAGDGPELESLLADIRSLGLSERVTLCGELSEPALACEYGKASVFVLPSVVDGAGDRDGMPNAVLEAMASGLPVVVATASAAGEVVKDGAQGYLVEPGDCEGMAVGIGKLLDDPELCTRMGRAGRELVEKDFDVDRNVAIMDKVFRSCAGGGDS